MNKMVCLYVYWLVPFNKVPTISDKVSSLSGRLSDPSMEVHQLIPLFPTTLACLHRFFKRGSTRKKSKPQVYCKVN